MRLVCCSVMVIFGNCGVVVVRLVLEFLVNVVESLIGLIFFVIWVIFWLFVLNVGFGMSGLFERVWFVIM